jgi:hypothetical protein
MKIAIVGHLGGMGRRYKAVCDFLNIPHVDFDLDNLNEIWKEKDLHSILICTPTETHYNLILDLDPLGVPILCEKPISFSMEEIAMLEFLKSPVAMVNQYVYLQKKGSEGASYYHNWNSGKDGLAWDCISIIALANQKPKLSNSSPIWTCGINGHSLDLKEMDHAYIEMIKRWWDSPAGDFEYIHRAHKRVHEGFYEI